MSAALSRSTTTALAAAAFLAGCATSANQIAAQNVSPLQYNGYDCQQIHAESNRIQPRIAALRAQIDQRAETDKALTGVGLVLFWPALFFLGGDAAEEGEYARLVGEQGALSQAAIAKRCLQVTTGGAT